jgi:hypothetical protein
MKQYQSAGLTPVVTGQTGATTRYCEARRWAVGLAVAARIRLMRRPRRTNVRRRYAEKFQLDPGFYAADLYINCMVMMRL